jgi:nucleoside-diphosphate-sugar epimerase
MELAGGHDVIVDAAAPYPLEPCLLGSEQWQRGIELAVLRTRRVLDAARLNRLRLAFVSSFTTLPRHEAPLRALEAAWRRSVYPYFEAKIRMEQMVAAAAREGLPAVIVNPAACLGPWEFRAEGSSFVRLVLERRLPVVMDHVLSVIDVRDIAIAIELALLQECFEQPIALAGHNISLAKLAGQIAALDGGGGVPLGIDDRLASVAAFWTATVSAAFGSPTPDAWRAVPLIADSFPMQPSSEQIAIGLTIRPLEETLSDAVAFHRGRLPG